MRFNIRIGRISQVLAPGYSSYHRCETNWYFVREHATSYDRSNSCFPLCEECWSGLTPEQRLPYYRQLWDEWNDPEYASWASIETAVMRGL